MMASSMPRGGELSPAAASDVAGGLHRRPSLGAGGDVAGNASRTGTGDVVWVPERQCAWCRRHLEGPATAIYCSKACRQSAWRLRGRVQTVHRYARRMRMAYADPPYPGLAKRYYGNEPTYAGEVDHAALIESLRTSFDGWALSTSARALRDVLPLCPPDALVLPWCKPNGVSRHTRGLHNCWEPLIVVPGRELTPGKRDFLVAKPARGGGKLMGRKPLAFCAFLFDALGLLPGDDFVDLFPGTGIVSRAWECLVAEHRRSSTPATSADGMGDGRADHRAITPAGFARAFQEANP